MKALSPVFPDASGPPSAVVQCLAAGLESDFSEHYGLAAVPGTGLGFTALASEAAT